MDEYCSWYRDGYGDEEDSDFIINRGNGDHGCGGGNGFGDTYEALDGDGSGDGIWEGIDQFKK